MKRRSPKGAKNVPRKASQATAPMAESPVPPREGGVGATTPSQSRRGYQRRLRRLSHVRVALGDVLRGVEQDALDLSKARVLIYGFSTLASVIETDRSQTELVARLERLEGVVAGGLNGSSGPWRPAPPERGAEA